MTGDTEAKRGIDYCECHYGNSRLGFRGPKRPLDGSYTVLLGGSETYGKFVRDTFADVLEAQIREPVVNLGAMHAGLTLLLDEPVMIDIASRARVTVIQALGAQNMTNRFYRVHPRRNDRFLAASDSLHALYPDMDFTQFHFTGHMLLALLDSDRGKFERVVTELRTAWLARMRFILRQIPGERVLLWISERRPEDPASLAQGLPPFFVDRDMIEALAPDVSAVVEVVPSPAAKRAGLDGMEFEAKDRDAAEAMPNPQVHREVADALARVISPLGIAPPASDMLGFPSLRAHA